MKYALPALLMLFCSLPATAQHHSGHEHSVHAAHHADGSEPLQQPGESISASLGEVIALLESDPNTDWSRVDLDRLARHLQQMNHLFTSAEVASEPITGGARYRVQGDQAALEAALAMVPAHAAMTASESGWRADVEEGTDELVVTIRGSEGDESKIRALGFFGWMSSGDHHRAHHLMMARGR